MFLSFSVFQFFSLSKLSLGGNYIDLIIIVVLLYFASEAWRVGLWIILADFFSFLISLIVALRFYSFAAGVLRVNFALAHSLSNALGFLLMAVVTELIIGFVLSIPIRKIPAKYWKNNLNKLLAIFPALGEGIILISFMLTLIIALPVVPQIKSDITNSRIGGYLLQKTTGLEAKINEVFGGVIEDSLTYLTIRPGTGETIPISVGEIKLSVDEESESRMLDLVNEERRSLSIGELSLRNDVVPVSRAHARDMWTRKYFGHVSPDGDDVGDRLQSAGIQFTFAGENLALAPTLATAHTGLMNSEGHRANILEPKFKRVGIGVIDNGVYGKMFVQVFTD
jgi:uncharacterized protein YkwD